LKNNTERSKKNIELQSKRREENVGAISVGKENIFLIEIIGNLISFDGDRKRGKISIF
jgi:hypothetical protein